MTEDVDMMCYYDAKKAEVFDEDYSYEDEWRKLLKRGQHGLVQHLASRFCQLLASIIAARSCFSSAFSICKSFTRLSHSLLHSHFLTSSLRNLRLDAARGGLIALVFRRGCW